MSGAIDIAIGIAVDFRWVVDVCLVDSDSDSDCD